MRYRVRALPWLLALLLASQLLAVKSFVPQCIRLLNHLAVYITKHQATMSPYLTAAQSTALSNVVSAAAAFYGVTITEEA